MSKIFISSHELSISLMKLQENRLESFSFEETNEHEFSKEFESKMQKLMRSERTTCYPFSKTRIRAAVFIAIVLLIIMTTTVFALEPLRIKVFEFFENIFEEFSIITIDDNESKITPATILECYKPGYIPEGYVFSEENSTQEFISTYFREDPFDEISLVQSTKQSFMPTIDTEGINNTEIELSNGMKGFYCTNKGVNILVLHNSDYAFMLSSQSEMDELIKFAESLRAED